MLHATLGLVALHRHSIRDERFNDAYFRHRGEAIRMVSERLLDPTQATSDATLGAVALLSTNDNIMSWPDHYHNYHVTGLATLIELRGGIDTLSTNMHVQRVVAWADLLHAASHDRSPLLQVSSCTRHQDLETLYQLSGVPRPADTLSVIQTVLERIRVLSKAKAFLLSRGSPSNSVLRQTFSSILFQTERLVVELGRSGTMIEQDLSQQIIDRSPPSVSIHEFLRTEPGLTAIKSAVLIFTYHALRDLAITAACFDRLMRRLRINLVLLMEEIAALARAHSNFDADRAMTILLWMCLNGWKVTTSGSREEDRQWFITQARILCRIARVETLEDLTLRMASIAFLEKYCIPACAQFWADMQLGGADNQRCIG